MQQTTTSRQDEQAGAAAHSQTTAVAKPESAVQTQPALEKIAALSLAVGRRKRTIKLLQIPTYVVAGSLAIECALLNQQVIGVRPLHAALAALFAAGGVSLGWLMVQGAPAVNRAVNALSGTEDMSAIGVLAEALPLGEPALSLAGSELVRLLPTVNRSTFNSLKPAQREALQQALNQSAGRFNFTRFNPALAIALLELFERFGDERELPLVTSLAAGKTKTEWQRRLRAAAGRCRAGIIAHLAAQQGARAAWIEARLQTTSEEAGETAGSIAGRLRRIARVRRRNLAITAAAAVSGTGIAFYSMAQFAAGSPPGLAMTAAMFSCLAGMLGFAVSGTYEQRNLTNALIHSDDISIIPALIQAAATVEISGAAAVAVLTRLLPRLRASDALMLTAEDRALLHAAMGKHARNRVFMLCALRALQQVGDASSIAAVRRIASRSSSDREVFAAANECLEYLQDRAAQAEATMSLLRASSSSEVDSETLVRPAEPGAVDLVRSSAPPVSSLEPDTANARDVNSCSVVSRAGIAALTTG